MRHVLAAILILFVGAEVLQAADQPVTGRKLLLKRTASREKLVLVLNDPAVPIPAPVSALAHPERRVLPEEAERGDDRP